MQKILGLHGQELVLSVVLHLGTALSLIIFFFRDIIKLIRNVKTLALIVAVTVITGIIGVTGKDFLESLFASLKTTALALIVTGIILILTRKFMHARRNNLNLKDAVILGITQGIAIIPGISRSGITVSALLFRGIDRETAFRFSFLASIPAVLGAAMLEAKDIGCILSIGSANLILGFTFSFFSGLMALWILKLVIYKAKLYYFGYYCILVAIIALLFLK